ncbi:MAG: hypothetical protein HWN65_23000 [Candidatus Helarchaeota archaeon]|nr:hypothetical protein [Candidatus Helarchaeota archaeon]
MGAGKVVGGIIALIGGIFVLIPVFINIEAIFTAGSTEGYVMWIINLLVGLLATIGGILGLASKKGGALALIAGLVALLLPITAFLIGDPAIAQMFSQLSGILGFTGLFIYLLVVVGPPTIFLAITIESIIILVGGVIMLASSSE